MHSGKLDGRDEVEDYSLPEIRTNRSAITLGKCGGVPSLEPIRLSWQFPVFSEKYRENRFLLGFLSTLFPRNAPASAAYHRLHEGRTFQRTGN